MPCAVLLVRLSNSFPAEFPVAEQVCSLLRVLHLCQAHLPQESNLVSCSLKHAHRLMKVVGQVVNDVFALAWKSL